MSQTKSAQPTQTAKEGDEPTGHAPSLQPQFQDHIGRQLRAVYDDILSQPVPDRFRELMEKLDEKTGGAK